jgi:hypothetical protein
MVSTTRLADDGSGCAVGGFVGGAQYGFCAYTPASAFRRTAAERVDQELAWKPE